MRMGPRRLVKWRKDAPLWPKLRVLGILSHPDYGGWSTPKGSLRSAQLRTKSCCMLASCLRVTPGFSETLNRVHFKIRTSFPITRNSLRHSMRQRQTKTQQGPLWCHLHCGYLGIPRLDKIGRKLVDHCRSNSTCRSNRRSAKSSSEMPGRRPITMNRESLLLYI